MALELDKLRLPHVVKLFGCGGLGRAVRAWVMDAAAGLAVIVFRPLAKCESSAPLTAAAMRSLPGRYTECDSAVLGLGAAGDHCFGLVLEACEAGSISGLIWNLVDRCAALHCCAAPRCAQVLRLAM